MPANLRRGGPAYNPIGNYYLEMIIAPDALNRLVAHLCESSMGGNMNLLLSLQRGHSTVITT